MLGYLTLYIDRLENEHIGNTDQYRVTHEVPLPYLRENDHEEGWDIDGESLRSVKLPNLNSDGRVSEDRMV